MRTYFGSKKAHIYYDSHGILIVDFTMGDKDCRDLCEHIDIETSYGEAKISYHNLGRRWSYQSDMMPQYKPCEVLPEYLNTKQVKVRKPFGPNTVKTVNSVKRGCYITLSERPAKKSVITSMYRIIE